MIASPGNTLRIGREKVRERISLVHPKMGLERQGEQRQSSKGGDILNKNLIGMMKADAYISKTDIQKQLLICICG